MNRRVETRPLGVGHDPRVDEVPNDSAEPRSGEGFGKDQERRRNQRTRVERVVRDERVEAVVPGKRGAEQREDERRHPPEDGRQRGATDQGRVDAADEPENAVRLHRRAVPEELLAGSIDWCHSNLDIG